MGIVGLWKCDRLGCTAKRELPPEGTAPPGWLVMQIDGHDDVCLCREHAQEVGGELGKLVELRELEVPVLPVMRGAPPPAGAGRLVVPFASVPGIGGGGRGDL